MKKRFELVKMHNGDLAIKDNQRDYIATISKYGAKTLLYWLNDLAR